MEASFIHDVMLLLLPEIETHFDLKASVAKRM